MRKLIVLSACSIVMLSASAYQLPNAAQAQPDAAQRSADTARMAAALAAPATLSAADKSAAGKLVASAESVKALARPADSKLPAAAAKLATGSATGATSATSATSAASAATADRVATLASSSEEAGQVDLSVKIAERLAEMRAKQAARMAAAARARKQSDARHKASQLAAAKPKISQQWAYEGELGPEHWGQINPAWAQCSKGQRQSPIDLRDGIKVNLDELDVDYRPTLFSEIDNGHTVRVNLQRGNFLTVGAERYALVEFHFHRPSEERINGKGAEMVVHLVHRSASGKLAVLAVLLERGAQNDTLQVVWNHIPLEKQQVATPGIELDPLGLLPQRREYYTYMGSLTSPPCSENVLWLVLKQPMTASPAQMALFSRLYPLNARPLQPSQGRMIKESK